MELEKQIREMRCKDLGVKIREYREKNELTLEEMSKKAKVSIPMLIALEHDKWHHKMSARTVNRIRKAIESEEV